MGFLDLNAAEGIPLHSFARTGEIAAPAPREWLRPRRAAPAPRWKSLIGPIALALPTSTASAAVTGSYFGDPLLGLLAAALSYAVSAPAIAWFAQGTGKASRADHTKI